ncbi:MAG: hypothetical protein ACI35R_09130 [Bacillus sp. (in: firmicutes)]
MKVELTRFKVKRGKTERVDECIDPNFTPIDLTTEVVMIPDEVRSGMNS